jgi:transposase-like protein
MHEVGDVQLRGVRLESGHLSVARFAALPLDALLRAAARVRRDLVAHHVEPGDWLDPALQAQLVITELTPNSDEHLAAVATIFRRAKSEKRPGAQAVAMAAGVSPRTAEKWVRRARERFEATRDRRFDTGTRAQPRAPKADRPAAEPKPRASRRNRTE